MMEFPPINSTRVILGDKNNSIGEYSPALLSPTTRSPIGISPRDMINMFSTFDKDHDESLTPCDLNHRFEK